MRRGDPLGDGSTPRPSIPARKAPHRERVASRRVYFSETTVMRGGTSSALISGYSTFLRLRSEGRCCWRGRKFLEFGTQRERDARHKMEGGRRSVGQRSAVRTGRTLEPTHRASGRRSGVPGTPARRKSPRAASGGASPRVFRFQGFGGLSGGDAPSWAWFWCGPWWPWG